MVALYPWLVAIPPLLLLGAILAPSQFANRRVRAVRKTVQALAIVAFVSSVAATFQLALFGTLDIALIKANGAGPFSLGVYFDSLAAVMSLLIGFIGVVITRYSSRYLDGDPRQGRFFRWIAFTLGAVLLLVVSGNLVMFTLSWMLTSLGLHQLLIHYPERPWAVWAARKKFLISRLGDILLLTALSLTFYCFGSFEYGEIFGKADAFREDSSTNAYLISLIATLYVLGAMTKSAQFPFHSWLPDTMETPTPVSALMHAGIINAGGFLIIRLSPLVSVSDLALDFLTIVGAFTALLGAVVMITQSSIKRALAYSTVAQMGFMMFQCGLGAFSAALLHIVAHSLYKAHAFLSSGSVLEGATGAKVESSINPTASRALSGLAVAALVSMAIFMGFLWLLGIDLLAKPGGPVLGVILVVAMTHLVWRATLTGSRTLKMWGIGGAVLVSVGYLVAYLTVDRILSASVSHQTIQFSMLDWVMAVFILFGFLAVFALQAMVTTGVDRPFLRAFYVHALNGFYLDIPARRITARFWGHESPTP